MSNPAPDYVVMTDGKKSKRKYTRITLDGFLSDGTGAPIPGAISMYVDERSSIVTTDPRSFELWINN